MPGKQRSTGKIFFLTLRRNLRLKKGILLGIRKKIFTIEASLSHLYNFASENDVSATRVLGVQVLLLTVLALGEGHREGSVVVYLQMANIGNHCYIDLP